MPAAPVFASSRGPKACRKGRHVCAHAKTSAPAASNHASISSGAVACDGCAAAAPGAPAQVNCWEAPTGIPSWKEEHIVIAVLTGWAVVIYGAKKAFGGGGKKEEAK